MGKEYNVRNVSELMVEEYLDGCIKSSDMCACPKCRADVKACSLNKLPPQYVVTEVGELLVQSQTLIQQSRVDIITAIMSGVVVVKGNPKH